MYIRNYHANGILANCLTNIIVLFDVKGIITDAPGCRITSRDDFPEIVETISLRSSSNFPVYITSD